MGGLANFLFGDDEEEPKKSGRAKKPGPGGGRKPPLKKSGRPGKTPRKTVAGGSGTRKKKGAKSAPAKQKGSSMPVPTPEDLELELEADTVQVSEAAQLAANFYALWVKKDTDEGRAKVIRTLTKDKKRLKRIKEYLPQELRDAVDSKDDASTGGKSTPTAPKGLDKAQVAAAKAKAEQLKADGKDRGGATFELASDNYHPDIINHVITEVYV